VGGHKVARPIGSLEEYMNIRNSPGQVVTVQMARGGDERAKLRLAQFNYSGHYPDGIVKGNKLPSMAFGFDVDEPDEFQRIASLLVNDGQLTVLGNQLGLLMLERSARQGGHAVFKREAGKTILENQVRIAMALGCEMDTNTHDINRVYFTTTGSAEDLLFVSQELFTDGYDEATVAEEARVLARREEYHLERLPEGAHNANKHFRPSPSPVPSTGEGSVCHPLTQGERPNEVSEGNMPTLPIKGEVAQSAGGGLPLSYLGIEYTQIISKYWELFNDGNEPSEGDRNVKTFELAMALRPICEFNAEKLMQVIPR